MSVAPIRRGPESGRAVIASPALKADLLQTTPLRSFTHRITLGGKGHAIVKPTTEPFRSSWKSCVLSQGSKYCISLIDEAANINY